MHRMHRAESQAIEKCPRVPQMEPSGRRGSKPAGRHFFRHSSVRVVGHLRTKKLERGRSAKVRLA